MNAIALRPDTSALLARVKATSLHVAQVLEVLPLTSPEAEAQAAALLRALETLDRESEDARKAEKEPHLRAGREVDATFKAARVDLERVSALLRSRLAEAALARRLAQETAKAAAIEAARAGDAETASLALADPVFAPVALAGVSERHTWEVAGIDLSAIPREYLQVDMIKVRAEIDSATRAGREPQIPGVTFRRGVSLRVAGLK